MKVFVYSKKTSKKIAIVNNVKVVCETPEKCSISFVTNSGENFCFNTKEVKTTTYQN